eukprot:SAG31_NODE_1038_length_10218_cov_16.418223_14_plen_98_part_00
MLIPLRRWQLQELCHSVPLGVDPNLAVNAGDGVAPLAVSLLRPVEREPAHIPYSFSTFVIASTYSAGLDAAPMLAQSHLKLPLCVENVHKSWVSPRL